MEKIVRKAKKTPMLRIGEDMKNSKWYYLSDNVIKYVYDKITDEDIEQGVYVKNMKVEKKSGRSVITFLEIEKSADMDFNVDPDEDPDIEVEEIELPTEEKEEKKEYRKSFSRPKVERVEIIAQAIGHMTSRVVAQIASNYEVDDLNEVISKVYGYFADAIKEFIENYTEE